MRALKSLQADPHADLPADFHADPGADPRADPTHAPKATAWISPVGPGTHGAAQNRAAGRVGTGQDDAQAKGKAAGARADAAAAPRTGKIGLNTSILPPFAAAFAVRFGGIAAAQQCPKHIADAQALIDRVGARFEADASGMPGDGAGLINALLDDARVLLAAARHNHEHAQAQYDHARAFAKVDAAFGHARAAEIMLTRLKLQR